VWTLDAGFSVTAMMTRDGSLDVVDETDGQFDNGTMTQTIDLERDVYAVAQTLARREHSTVGAVVNRVLRRTLVDNFPPNSTSEEPGSAHLTIDQQTGWPSVRCSQSFTSEDVYGSELDTT